MAEPTNHDMILALAAPDLAALRWKLDLITEETREDDRSLPSYSAEFVRQMLLDVDRLLPSAA